MENGHEPASKEDIGLNSELRQEMAQLRSDIRQGFDDLKERMRDFQTEIIRAFYGYTQTTDAKVRESEQADMVLHQRLTAIESRVLEVEKRLNMPPQVQ